jgi:DNA-binding NtrC family response regulator
MASIGSEQKSGRRTILVVDDDGDIRQALEGTLQYEGFSTPSLKRLATRMRHRPSS